MELNTQSKDKYDLYAIIDTALKQIEANKVEPGFTAEIEKRRNTPVKIFHTNDELLRIFAYLIAYSQNANSDNIKKLINGKSLDNAFAGFDTAIVSQLNPFQVLDDHWKTISAMRFEAKVFHIIGIARKLHRDRSIVEIFQKIDALLSVWRVDDLDDFWKAFDVLLAKLKKHKVNFFQSTTSLLHLLMEMGYDCVKPDLAVMRAAQELHLITDEKGDQNLRQVVRTLQEYALLRGLKPSVVDFYFLIRGGQKWARQFVHERYYQEMPASINKPR